MINMKNGLIQCIHSLCSESYFLLGKIYEFLQDPSILHYSSASISAVIITIVKIYPVYATKIDRRVQIQLHSFLISVPDKGEWLTSRPDRFNLEKRNRYPLCKVLGVWVCHTGSLDVLDDDYDDVKDNDDDDDDDIKTL